MAKTKMSVGDFQKFKDEGRIMTFTTAYDYSMASVVDDSDVDIILVGDSLAMTMLGRNTTVGVTVEDMINHIKPVVIGAPNTFVIGDMPFGSYNASEEQAIMTASRIMMEGGCDCVKLEGGVWVCPAVEKMVRSGIPVCGHIGLTPQSAGTIGGYRVQGGTPESAKQLIEDAKALEAAGCFAIVIECVPSNVAKAVQDAVKIPILGIGAGPDVACQVLVLHDLLGIYNGHKPKFVKRFANIREEMVKGLNQFVAESKSGEFPSPEFSFNKVVDIPKLY